LWWLYFDTVGSEGLSRNRGAAFAWGYGHFALYGAVGAIGAGVQAQLELGVADHGLAAASVGVPVAVALLAIAFLQRTANHRVGSAGAQAVAATVVVGVTLTLGARGPAILDLVLAGVMTALVVRELRAPQPSPRH
jgi:low temperature requirement protein LtrA